METISISLKFPTSVIAKLKAAQHIKNDITLSRLVMLSLELALNDFELNLNSHKASEYNLLTKVYQNDLTLNFGNISTTKL